MMDQTISPLADALHINTSRKYVPFDVPGHKGTLGFLADYYGEVCVSLDKNSRKELDYLCQPEGCVRDAQKLAAEAFGAQYAWFIVGGTTASVQAMIMSACSPGDKILLPRNVHISVINAVILSGAVPVYIHPPIHPQLGIALGVQTEDMKTIIENNTDAKAIVINNPTYYGVCSNLREIVHMAHQNDMLVLVDEAHGTHFYFSEDLPASAMCCGADMSAVSMHKTGGSLTQSSILLGQNSVNPERVQEIINLTCTTSASYLLLSSLDLARRFMATKGEIVLRRILALADSARAQINEIDGFYAFGKEIFHTDAVYDFDRTKLSINTTGIGLAGIEVFNLLRDSYGIQLEFGDMSNILAVCSLGDTEANLDTLVNALRSIAQKYHRSSMVPICLEYEKPLIRMAPRKAFFSNKKNVPLYQAVGMIAGNAVMCYPPGIPLLAPGELITEEIVEHIVYAEEKRCQIQGITHEGVQVVE